VGNRTSVNYPNASSEVYQYDNLNRLTRKETYDATGTLIRAYDYTLHTTGRRTRIDESSGRSTTYGYDDLYRLTSENISDSQNGDYVASYQYDAVGNRTYSTLDGVQTAYTYDDNDRLTQQGGTRYTYDANGNTLSETLDNNTTTYNYNAKNELVSMEEGGNTAEYGYNPNGIRTSKTEGGTTTSYIVDENRDYAQVLIEDDGTNRVSYTYGDDLISQARGGEVYYYHYDGLGSTRSLTDSQGNLANTYDYEAFGEVLNQTGTVENGYLFAGEQFDSTLDQYYLRARYYNPASGRFTQQDSWMGNNSDPITLHKYLYANVDPVNNVDPSGNFSLGSMMTAINVVGTLSTVASKAQTILKFASGDSDISASELGSEIVLGLFTKGLGSSINKIKGLLPKSVREQIEKCFSNSFVAGTLVETRNGLVPIESIQIGDEVLSQDMASGEIEYQKVIHLIENEKDYEIYSFQIAGDFKEVIKATANHPFFVNGNWVEAVDVQAGDLLSLSDGKTLEVLHVSAERLATKVYNLTVDENHTYFVGEKRVLVHNTNFLCNFGKIRLERPLRSSDLGVEGRIKLLKGKFALEDGKAIYQIDYIEAAKGHKLDGLSIIETMKMSARNRGAKTLRIEATIANPALDRWLRMHLGKAKTGSGSYTDSWEIPL
jgi:RHS repeat-associated protein